MPGLKSRPISKATAGPKGGSEEGSSLRDDTTMLDPRMSRRRWVILALLFFITVINFIDRQTLSVLAPVIRASFHLSNTQYGRIVSAFQFGMMSGEIPMGAMMDRIGARIGLALAVFWWSSATAAQFLSRTGVQFGLTRFWMGTGECGNYSGGMKTVTRLFSKAERTLAIGIFNGGSMVGATVATPLIVLLLHRYGFRAAFLVPALCGMVWLPLWWWAYGREPQPSETSRGKGPGLKPLTFGSGYRGLKPAATPGGELMPATPGGELVPAATPEGESPGGLKHTPESLRSMLGESSSWAVMMCRFFIGPVIQFYWYWIPSYLYSVRHMSLLQIGGLAWIPFFMGGAGGVAGGWAAGVLLRRGVSVPRMRKLLMYGSSLLCCTSFFVPYSTGIPMALAMIGIAAAADNFLSANMYGAITDLFPDHKVGRATGLTGVAGGLSGLLFPLLTGSLVDHVSYTPVFLMVAIMPMVGTIMLFVLARRYRTFEGAVAG
jgi:MFS transporter, ACS family, hexuronate transporter